MLATLIGHLDEYHTIVLTYNNIRKRRTAIQRLEWNGHARRIAKGHFTTNVLKQLLSFQNV
ncbi:hypothetical protein KIN20_005578 [Parelaphostrongylus tenuis]|uniref:Uncharacterized protein n=1 Tax=Parelaphostrongylus tenuis TaxID=148309 RepID=A0AAD5QG76_PARTN|nr:hypothetical protein KIN20_005578 [Parelaphostrongylus tenuis]